jgi:hydroxymethylbilane synthase
MGLSSFLDTIDRDSREKMLIRLGTRQSPLALWQADYVSASLRALGHEVQLVKITTSGDVSTTPLGQSGGQGVFTKEIQRALLEERCDLAVHSLKDLPTEILPELRLAAVPMREDASDCLISKEHTAFAQLPPSARVGTGSPRRKAQLLNQRPDLQIIDIRGNVDTRLRKLEEGQYDAILLAYAGLHRLQFDARISEKLTHDQMLPAVGQAALGIEIRSDDSATYEAVRALDHLPTHAAVIAERTLLRSMRAGCLAPLAAHATLFANQIHLKARVYSSDGAERICIEHTLEVRSEGDWISCANQLGSEAAAILRERGAERLIEQARPPS